MVTRDELRPGDKVAWIARGSRGNLTHREGWVVSTPPDRCEIAQHIDRESQRADIPYSELRRA
jgi:hypothetical protein